MKKAILLTTKVVDTENGKRVERAARVINVPEKSKDNLQFFYDNIGCHTIDVVGDRIGLGVDIFCDDNALLMSDNPVWDYGNDLVLAGNLVIAAGVGSKGETLWFDQTDKTDFERMERTIDMLDKSTLMGVTQ